AVPALPGHFGSCPAQLAGLAISQDEHLLAVSLLSNCPATGRAGPGEILTFRLATGHRVATFHVGNGYPQSLSWTTAGGVAYDWAGAQFAVKLIPDATRASSSPRVLVKSSAAIKGFSGAFESLITPDGSTVFATVGDGNDLAIAEFSAKTGRALSL